MIQLIKRLAEALGTFFGRTSGRHHEANAESSVAQSIPPWVAWGLREIGFHEQPGNRGIEKYIALAHCGSVGDPWCAIFANAGLEASGIRGTRSALWRAASSTAITSSGSPVQPTARSRRCGAARPPPAPATPFYYLGENDRGVLALGGNQSDEVREQYEPRARIVGYFWPKALPLPNVGAIVVADDAREGSET